MDVKVDVADSPMAVVTGATGGIGAALVDRLVAAGYAVTALARDTDAVAKRRGVTALRVDLAEPAGLAAALPALERVDALLHCAGVADVAAVDATMPGLWRRMLDVNVVAVAELTRLLLPALRAAHGHVVFVNAAYGMTGAPNWSAYVGSKAALRELADSLRAEERPHRLRVTSVYPAGVDTPLLREVRAAHGREHDRAVCMRPESFAEVVLMALRAPADAHITDLAVRP